MILKKSAKKVLSNRSIFNKIKILVVTPMGAPGIGEHPPGSLDRTTDHLPGPMPELRPTSCASSSTYRC